MDRASGSGVFARDPDAVLDMTPLVLDSVPEGYEDATAFRIESNLREFKNITPINEYINESDTFSNDRGVVIFKSKKRR